MLPWVTHRILRKMTPTLDDDNSKKKVIEKFGHNQQPAGKMIVTISSEIEKLESLTCYVT